MTALELIQELQQHDGSLEVHFSYNYGDHWRTTVAPEVRTVEQQCVKYSEYHRMPQVVENDDDSDDDTKEGMVLVLSA